MQVYLDILAHILRNGKPREDRTGTGTLSCFGYQVRFPLYPFPLLTTKKVHFKSVLHELLWFLSGSTNVGYLKDNGVRIWDEWADEKGDLGPVYGKQWRSYGAQGIDQISKVIQSIKQDPYSRRHIVNAWNPEEIDAMRLPPCHTFFQFYVDERKLSCHLYQRSADVFLGLPFNIASYALLTLLIARVCQLEAGALIISLGDVHLYKNHLIQAKTQLARCPLPLPSLHFPYKEHIFDYTYADFQLSDYQHHPAIAAQVSV